MVDPIMASAIFRILTMSNSIDDEIPKWFGLEPHKEVQDSILTTEY